MCGGELNVKIKCNYSGVIHNALALPPLQYFPRRSFPIYFNWSSSADTKYGNCIWRIIRPNNAVAILTINYTTTAKGLRCSACCLTLYSSSTGQLQRQGRLRTSSSVWLNNMLCFSNYITELIVSKSVFWVQLQLGFRMQYIYMHTTERELPCLLLLCCGLHRYW